MIALLGGTGYVGAAFQSHLGRKGLEFEVVSRRRLDYTRVEILREYFRTRHSRFVILAAGYTGCPNVDGCEVNKAECLAADTLLPSVVRAACEDAGIPWGYVASGCIYSGCRPDGQGFRETDPPNFSFRQGPCSFYSRDACPLSFEAIPPRPRIPRMRHRVHRRISGRSHLWQNPKLQIANCKLVIAN